MSTSSTLLAPVPGPSASEFATRENAHHLLESLVCDFHWASLNAATLGYLVAASRRMGVELRLGTWRHMLYDNTGIAHLGLRYGAAVGLTPATTAAMSAFYESFGKALADTGAVLKARGPRTPAPTKALDMLAPAWKGACSAAGEGLKQLAPLTQGQLSSEYSDNSKILSAFLAEALAGETARLDPWGAMSLPVLSQRRRHARASTQQACSLFHAGHTVAATLENVSRNGLGFSCSAKLPVGSRVAVALANGRRLAGSVAHADGTIVGLKLDVELSADDPLFQG